MRSLQTTIRWGEVQNHIRAGQNVVCVLLLLRLHYSGPHMRVAGVRAAGADPGRPSPLPIEMAPLGIMPPSEVRMPTFKFRVVPP